MSSLTTGPFQNLSATWAQLMQLTPQQMANASAPDYLKIAAMNAQDNIRQQGQPAAGPAAPPVAQQIVDKSVGAPPAGQAMPASPAPAPTQMAARGGYVHDYGVASLPYEANYGHGGIVSFAEGGEPETKAAEPEESQIKRAWTELSQTEKDAFVGAATTGLSLIPYGKTLGAFGKFVSKYGRKLLPLVVPAGGIAAARVLDARSKSPALDAAKTALAGDEALPSDPADTETAPEKDPFAGLGGLGGAGASLLNPVTLPAYAEQAAPEVKTREQIKAEREASDLDYGVGKDFYEQEKAKNDEKLSALEAQRKGVYSGQGLMDFGAAMASGESSNFLDNFAKAVPAYTGAVKSGNEYARNRQDLLDTHADLLRGQQRSEGRSDSTSALAEKAASVEANRLGRNVNIAGADARGLAQVIQNFERDKAIAELQDRAANRALSAAKFKIATLARSSGVSKLGLTADQKGKMFAEFAPTVSADVEALLDAKGIPAAERLEPRQNATMELFEKALIGLGIPSLPTGAGNAPSGIASVASGYEDE